MRVLYVTFDGLMEPLGASQVVAPIVGLANRGFEYSIISLEKDEDLCDRTRVDSLARRLADAGINWTYRSYQRSGGVRGVGENFQATIQAASESTAHLRPELVHARAHLPALVARGLQVRFKTPYVFDFRGYWLDERREEGRWIVNDAALRLGRAVENHLLRKANAVVCLTDLAKTELSRRVLPGVEVRTITTVADYDRFASAIPGEMETAQRQLAGKLVVGYVGSLNASYAVDESVAFFRALLQRRADAHLLCLTRQEREMSALLEQSGLPADAWTVSSVPHEAMPSWWKVIDWGLLFLNSPGAKLGSMPTKLAEMFAAGVRPLQFGCNTEVSDWVRRAGTGLVLSSLSPAELERAASFVASSASSDLDVERARTTTQPHFGLDSGVSAYAELLHRAATR